MDVSNMRYAISGAYPGDRWKARVNTMPENQVIAIYNHFLRDGVFNKQRIGRPKEDPNFRQMTIFDYGVPRN